MQWIIHYDIVAFAIISAILIVFSTFNNLKTFTNRVYKRLLIVSLLSVVTDIASSVTGSYFSTDYPKLNYLMSMLHYITLNFVPCLYSLFAYSMVYETGKMSKKWFSLIYVPYIINLILVIINPFTNIYFYYDDFEVKMEEILEYDEECSFKNPNFITILKYLLSQENE